MLKKLIAIASLSLCLTQSVIAYPTVNPYLDWVCGVEAYGMRVTPDLDKKVEERLKELSVKTKYIFKVDVSNVLWGYGVVEPTVAGATYTQFGPGLILFNPVYLNKYREEFIEVVVRHELAHEVVERVFGSVKDAHGREWQYVMRELGDKNPKPYHDYTFCVEKNFPYVLSF